MEEFRTMGSMADKLMDYVSSAPVHDSNYEIALLILKNYAKVRKMNQKQIAELCFVSEASISRFCRFLGFNDFRDFREQMDQDFSVRDDYSRRLQNLMKTSAKDAAEYYRNELMEAMKNTVNEQLFKDATEAVKLIHDCGHVSVFSHHFLWDVGRFLQSKLMMMGKYINAYQSYEMQKEDAGTLDENSLAVICTVGGSWYTRYDPIYKRIVNSGCHQLILTQNMSSPYLNRADLVMQCGTSNADDTGKYSMLAGADVMILRYLREYGEE
jgi:RpiR family carbohydrate utilization transcriptional regulator